MRIEHWGLRIEDLGSIEDWGFGFPLSKITHFWGHFRTLKMSACGHFEVFSSSARDLEFRICDLKFGIVLTNQGVIFLVASCGHTMTLLNFLWEKVASFDMHVLNEKQIIYIQALNSSKWWKLHDIVLNLWKSHSGLGFLHYFLWTMSTRPWGK